jgi:hypothetical protein
MKLKNIVIAVLLCASSAIASAQNFRLGDQVVNLSLGLGTTYYSTSYYSTSVPPISISYEKAFKDGIFDKGVIGIGGSFSYASSSYSYFGYTSTITNIFFGVRGSLHYPIIDEPKLDTYAGLTLGYRVASYSNTNSLFPTSGSGLRLPIHIGAHYYFTDQFSGLVELGWGVAYLSLGVGYKF